MGFFAKTCAKCKKSVVSSYKVQDGRAESWESIARAYHPDGGTTSGVYDGYGRINGHDLMQDWDDLKMVHAKCVVDGDTFENLPKSEDCPSQGFFDWD